MARTRSFDTTVALDRAMRLFWQHGYDGTSMEDLTTALGIAKPSLYSAFGNKRQLFERALERYTAAMGARVEQALAEPTALAVARAFLSMYYADSAADNPAGCFLVQGGLACSAESADVQGAVTARRREAETHLARRFARAQKEGDLPTAVRPADLARLVCTLGQGLSVQAVGGATPAQRQRVVDLALRGWPFA